MKGRREFQLLIADIRDALADVARENRCADLFHATWELVRFEALDRLDHWKDNHYR